MSVCCKCCVLSGRGLCGKLITRKEDAYRLWCFVVCYLETLWKRKPWPTGGCCTKRRREHYVTHWKPSNSLCLHTYFILKHWYQSYTSPSPYTFMTLCSIKRSDFTFIVTDTRQNLFHFMLCSISVWRLAGAHFMEYVEEFFVKMKMFWAVISYCSNEIIL
jgi:hypothetical protein